MQAKTEKWEGVEGKPICVSTTDYYTYDFTKPQPHGQTSLLVSVGGLGLQDAKERHSFLLLAGTKLNSF